MVRSTAAAGAILAGLLAVGACQAPPQYAFEDLPWNYTPPWAQSLGENVEPVPPRVPPEDASPATPTDYGRADSIRHGTPRDLTSVVESRSMPAASSVKPPAPGGSAATDSTKGGVRHQIDLVLRSELGSLPGHSAAAGAAMTDVAPIQEPVAQRLDEPSALELMYRGRLDAPQRDLSLYGYEFFDSIPADGPDGPVPAEYVVLAGDELVLTFSGSIKAIYRLEVQPDGTIAIPDIGNVVVAGSEFADLEGVISGFTTDQANRRGFRLAVSMGRLSQFRVNVVGEVVRPGALNVPRSATVLTALATAGGPKRTGSLRRITVVRRGEQVAQVDLYDFLTTGSARGLALLEPEDTIVVPTLRDTVAVAGYVLRPAIYELVGAINVGELVQMAGGLTPFSFRLNAQIETTQDGRRRAPVDIALDEAGMARGLENGELLVVSPIDGERMGVVEVNGEVVRPGRFQYREGMRVADVLTLVDGLTVDAYLPQAIISRQVGAPGQIEIVPDRTSVATTRRILIIDLAKAMEGDPEHNVPLRPLDSLEVQSRSNAVPRPSVAIMGAVRSPGTFELTAGMRVSDLVAIAGNVEPEVYFDEAELLRRGYDDDQRGLRMFRYRFDLGRALKVGGEADPELSNGDQVVIRRLRFAQVRVQVDGEVRFPGPYAFPAGTRISDLLSAAGGILPNADLRASVFTRRSVRQNQLDRFRHLKERTQQLYEQALERLVMGGHANEGLAAKLSLEQTKEMLDRIESSQSTGRIVIPFCNDDFPGSIFDLTLEEGDTLLIKPRQETVSVLGQVFNPGTFVAEPGLTVQNLLERSGGITADGDGQRLYVVRADGTVQGLDQGHYALYRSTRMLPGDVVLVPRRAPERTLYSQLTDIAMLARQSAEIMFILGRILDDDSNLSFTSVFEGRNFSGVDDALLNRGRR